MVYNLLTKGFTGNSLLAVPTTSGTEVVMAAAESSAGDRYLLAANANLTTGKTLSIDLTPWGVPASVGTQTRISASQDGYVNQGSPTTSFNGSELRVRNSGTAPAGRDVTYLKFPVSDIDPNTLTHAMLGIYASDPGATSGTSAGIIAHVYGVTDNAWSAGSITWNNAPNLGDPAATISTIDNNYVDGIGVSAEIVGQFAATGTEQLLQVDVTRWITERLAAGASNVTFLIARQIRYDGDVDASQSLSIRSTEYASGTYAPTLTIAAVPEP